MILRSKRGLSMVELLAVLVILGILSAVAVVSISNLLENTRLRADQAQVITLNQATRLFALSDESSFQSWLTLDGASKIDALVAYGYLSRPLTTQHTDSFYTFDETYHIWCYQNCQTIVSAFDFSNPNFEVTDFTVKTSHQNFKTQNGLLIASPPSNGDDILFFPNPRAFYSIEVTGEIQPRGGNIFGGFGVFVETTLRNTNNVRDDGLVVQLDRHEGQVLLRGRVNGTEPTSRIYQRINLDFDTQGNVLFSDGGSSRHPQAVRGSNDIRDHVWWDEPHTLRVVVEPLGNQKQLNVFLDGAFVFSHSIRDEYLVEEPAFNYTGLRVWVDVDVHFSSLDIRDLND